LTVVDFFSSDNYLAYATPYKRAIKMPESKVYYQKILPQKDSNGRDLSDQGSARSSSIDNNIQYQSDVLGVVSNTETKTGEIFLEQPFAYRQELSMVKSEGGALQLNSNAIKSNILWGKVFGGFGRFSGTVVSGVFASVAKVTRYWSSNTDDVNLARIFLEQAIVYREKQQYPEAIQTCEALLKINPKFVEAYKVLGDVYQRLEKFAIAIDYYQKAIAIKPDFTDAYANLADLYTKQQQWRQAYEYYQKALKLKPDLPQVYKQLPLVEQNLDNWSQVPPRLVQAKSSNSSAPRLLQSPDSSKDISDKKQLLLEGDSVKSSSSARSTSDHAASEVVVKVATSTNKAEEQVSQGDDFAEKQQWQSAILHYQKAVLLDPKVEAIYLKLGKVLTKVGEQQQALLCYREGVKHNPQSYELYFNLGIGFTQQNNWQQAKDCYRQALQLNPSYWEALHNLGSVLGYQELWSEAITVYRQAIRLKSEDPRSYNDLGLMLLQNHQPEEAISAIRKAIALKADFAEAYCNFGDAFVQIGQWRKAITAYQSAAKIKPELPRLSQKIAYALFRQSEEYKQTALEQIMQEIEREPKNVTNYYQALEINNSNPELYLGLGNALIAQKNIDGAIAAYQKVVQLEPKNVEATIRLTNALMEKDPSSDINTLVESLLKRPSSPPVAKEKDPVIKVNTAEVRETLILPHSDRPRVSIIIPVYNQIKYTLKCLSSLVEHIHQDTLVEVIVVNDCSGDDTQKKLEQIDGLTLINNPQNLGFIHSCNKAAGVAQGEYLYFLNNDTEICPQAIESLLEVFLADSQVGVVGSKLIYPNGSLQEAGNIIWQDGAGWNYGRKENPFDPQYNYLREVDYCSGASLMVKKAIFDSLGGFDRDFAPAYYEDTDLCFAIRHQLGLKVVYQPKSEVVHYEGVTSGTSTDSGVKQYQIVNAQKFQQKWQRQLETKQYLPNRGSENISEAARKYQGVKTILVIDSYVPCYDKDSGSRRLFQLLKIFRELNYHVIFVADNGFKDEPYVSLLQGLNIEVLYTRDGYGTAITQQIKERLSLVDIAWLCHPDNHAKYAPLIRQYSQIKIVYDTIDLHYLRMKRAWELSPQSRNIENMRLWVRMQSQELQAAQEADLTVTISSVERDILEQQTVSNLAVVPNLHVPYTGDKPGFSEREGLLFIGGYNHKPNIDAVTWLCRKIMPLVWERLPKLTVTLLGSNPTKKVVDLAKDERIYVPGHVVDVTNYFLSRRVFVAPLRYGAGMKGKIGQSLEYALPIVSTKIGIEGMNLVQEKDVLEANMAEEFALEIIRLYQDEALWVRLASCCHEAIATYSPERVKKSLMPILANLT